ncbi:MAG: hypothetical protein K2P87_04355 [Lachnospiraceae bacterium]|nr:hypothetical protein [Lachnospiraceae bacterium]
MAERQDYRELIQNHDEEELKQRFIELKKTADDFIEQSHFQETVFCNERILMQVILDYYSDIDRLKAFHGIERVRTEKIFAYTIAWIVKRKPLQYNSNSYDEKDIFVNERFAAYLMLSECLCCGEENVSLEHKDKLKEYVDLLFYYFKYRECNPQVVELAIASFKMGTLVLKK